MRLYIYICLLTLITTVGFSQSTYFKKNTLTTKVGVVTSSDKTPFLLRSKQYGLVPLESNILYLNSSFVKPYDSSGKAFDFGYGIEPHVILGAESQIFLPEAYIKAKWKAIEIYGGRRREVMGYVDTLGTMGSCIWSGNALPIPKVDIGIREFTPITKNGIFSVKGNFAYGWFGKGDSVQNVLLHQKSIYIRLGKPEWKIKLIAGLNHQAQWGGKPTIPFKDEISGQYITEFGHSFRDFTRVFLGKSVGNDTGLSWDEVDGVIGNEAGNRIGNHLGSIDLGFDIQLNEATKMKVYRQSIFEDGSLFYLNSITDGLSGISFGVKNGFNLAIEYLDTRSQGGRIYYGNIPELRGGDNYFNNGVYKDSWTYKGNTIGSPLLNPYRTNPTIISESPELNQNFIYNNRVQAFNLKADYIIKRISLMTQFVYSQNLGHYGVPINKNAFSVLQAGKFKIKNYVFSPRVSLDLGEYYPTSLGMDFSLIRQW
jgi:hypothetical protein